MQVVGRRVVAVVAVALGVGGCLRSHGPAIPALPGKGGPPWVEVTSPNFLVWSDAPVARAREIAQRMEEHRRIVVGVLFPHAELHAPKTLVLALRDAEEVGAYVPKEFVAYATSGGPLRQPVIIVPADAEGEEAIRIETHELTHAITFGVVPHQPHWFAEGLAGYFETAHVRAGTSAQIEIGRPSAGTVGLLRSQHPTPAAALFACKEHTCMDDMYYASTWALFSMLLSTRTAQLDAYLAHLASLPLDASPEMEDAVWPAVVPELPPDALDHALAQQLALGKGAVLHFDAHAEAVALAERPLAEADVLAARGIMRFSFAHDAPETRAELEAALTEDRGQLLARLVLSWITKAITVEDAKVAAAAHPDDWRAWWLVGFAAQRGPDAKEAREKLCALVGDHPPAGMPSGFCALR